MIMIAISSAPAAAQGTAWHTAWRSWASGLAATLNRWSVAYITWRIEQAAIALLWSMSDRELKDIGLTRSEITAAVRGEASYVVDEHAAASPAAGRSSQSDHNSSKAKQANGERR
jgi:uncharacterized protein YjiS (DUF1127 family)